MNVGTPEYLKKRKRDWYILLMLFLLVPVFFLLDLFLGSVSIPADEVLNVLLGGEASKKSWTFILLDSRLPQSITALSAGAGLAMGGLMLQSWFRNPLAGPDVLGISSGAMFGVALVVMGSQLFGWEFDALNGYVWTLLSAGIGACAVLLLIVFISRISPQPVTVIIAGLMIAYLIGALTNMLQHLSTRESLQQYVFWGFGSFSNLTLKQSLVFLLMTIGFAFSGLFFVKGLNSWILGESYARSMGMETGKFRWKIILFSGLITATVTAFCGPIAFIGIAVPHLTRAWMKSENHALLLPGVMVTGMLLALICSLLTRLPIFEQALPLNAVTSIIGAPVVIWVILRQRHSKRSAV
jgi:iron complex transport system permease protein